MPWPWQARQWNCLLHDYGLWWGLPLTLALALPWYVWANSQTGGALFEVFFWEHNIERGLGGGALRAHPWWFYGPKFFFDFLPWSPLLPLAVWLVRRYGWWREDPEARFTKSAGHDPRILGMVDVAVVAGRTNDVWRAVENHRTVRRVIDLKHEFGDGLGMPLVADVDDPREAIRGQTQGTCALLAQIALGGGTTRAMFVREDQVGSPVDGHR